MQMEGTIGRRNVAFFQSRGFQTFNFALLQRLNVIEKSVMGYSEMQAANAPASAQLQKSLSQLTRVVLVLERLQEVSRLYKAADVSQIHPEQIFARLHEDFGWPDLSNKTYQALLVNVAEELVANALAGIFKTERVSPRQCSVGFRRRGNVVALRICTPNFDWSKSKLRQALLAKDRCQPKLSDSLETILLRALLCVLEAGHIKTTLYTRSLHCIYFYLPAARQMQVFAQDAKRE